MAAKLKVDHLDENSIRARETNTSANVMPKSSLIIIIMNTGGANKYLGENRKEKCKQAICEIVTNTGATLFLLQEFTWKDIRSKWWKNFKWPEQLQYTGHNDAKKASLCIIYDVNKVTIEEYSTTLLWGTLEELQRIGRIQQGFSPFPRMCLRKVNTKEVPVLSFICISWHGRHNGITFDNQKKEFECLLEYALKLSEKEALPVIIAGDFNVKIKDIEKLVPDSLILHRYTPTARRDENDIIDFYISSISLVMSDMKALKWESQTKVDDVLLLFDHDPVVTSVTPGEAKGYKLAVKSSNAPQRESQTKNDDAQPLFDHDPVVTSSTTDETKGYNLDVKSSNAPQRRRPHTNRNTIRLVTPPVDRCVLSSPVDGQNHSIQRHHTTSVDHIPNRRHNTDAHNESCCRYCGERNHSSKNCKHGTYWQCILI